VLVGQHTIALVAKGDRPVRGIDALDQNVRGGIAVERCRQNVRDGLIEHAGSCDRLFNGADDHIGQVDGALSEIARLGRVGCFACNRNDHGRMRCRLIGTQVDRGIDDAGLHEDGSGVDLVRPIFNPIHACKLALFRNEERCRRTGGKIGEFRLAPRNRSRILCSQRVRITRQIHDCDYKENDCFHSLDFLDADFLPLARARCSS
jgi:hypothetical protein